MILISVIKLQETGQTLLAIPEELLPHFQELIRKGMNCWDRAHPELKKFADILEYGQVLQDYDAQA